MSSIGNFIQTGILKGSLLNALLSHDLPSTRFKGAFFNLDGLRYLLLLLEKPIILMPFLLLLLRLLVFDVIIMGNSQLAITLQTLLVFFRDRHSFDSFH